MREPTAGGVIFRRNKKGEAEFAISRRSRPLDNSQRHIEPGETAQVTARREIGEETGLKKIELHGWLAAELSYRRIDKLVLMTTQVYLVKALDPNEFKGEWMNGLKWFSFAEALDTSMKILAS